MEGRTWNVKKKKKKSRHFIPKYNGHIPRDKMPKLNFQYVKWWLKRFLPQSFPNFCKLSK